MIVKARICNSMMNMNEKQNTSSDSLPQVDLRPNQSSLVINLKAGKRPILYVTDSVGQVIFKLVLKRRKRQVVIKVKDPKVDLDLLHSFLISKLRDRVEKGGY